MSPARSSGSRRKLYADCHIHPAYNKEPPALELSGFGVSQAKEKFWMEQDDENTFAATIHILVLQFHSVATSKNIHGSFVRAKLSHGPGIALYILECSKEQVMESPGLI
jgi:hypothetical protein